MSQGPPGPQDFDPTAAAWDQKAFNKLSAESRKLSKEIEKAERQGDGKKARKLREAKSRTDRAAKAYGFRIGRRRKN